MKVADAAVLLGLEVKAGRQGLDREVLAGYTADLLSDVMARAPRGSLWVTLQTHENVVAVALLIEAAGIVVTGGREPEEAACRRAESENIPLLTTPETSFTISGKLYALLSEKEKSCAGSGPTCTSIPLYHPARERK
ncbi:MAG: DRTGG domain-containing protein [Bacillota bacterium]